MGADIEDGKEGKKMVFLDCYTSWCGPCKSLAKYVFTNDTVADFYNKQFICVQMDMEKGEGPELAKRYEVGAYPTLLYIDARGELKHCVTGYMKPAVLIKSGEKALAGDATLEVLQSRYEGESVEKSSLRSIWKYCIRLVDRRCNLKWLRSILTD